MKIYMKNSNGFSLIEIVVVMGILSLLVTGAFFIGFPEYNRYVISSEHEYLVDTLLESQARSLVSGTHFVVSTWSNGYCIQDISNLCVVPVHNLPRNMVLASVNFATSTKIILTFTDSPPENFLKMEINIDQNGFILGR
jgi:prepilin-type N-terminal cleavage/methylation domain-containing protein